MILLGYVATTNVEHLGTAVLDRDCTFQSRELIDVYRASNYFDITYYVADESTLLQLLDSGKVRAGMIIPAGYEEQLLSHRQPQIAFLIDGSDPNVSNVALAAAQTVGQAQSVKVVKRQLGIAAGSTFGPEVRPRVLYNPEMKSSSYMIPALVGIILQYLTTLFTVLAIVREREQGTIEQLIVTPIKSYELVLGKVVPYVVIAFFDLGEVLMVGVFWFVALFRYVTS